MTPVQIARATVPKSLRSHDRARGNRQRARTVRLDGGVLDLANGRDAERARNDRDMRRRPAFLQHEAAQPSAVVVEQRGRTHEAGNQHRILRQQSGDPLAGGALTQDVFIKGLVAGASLMAGAFIAKRFVLHLKPEMFRLVMDAIMVAAAFVFALLQWL